MAEVMSESTGIVGSLTGVVTCLAKAVGAVASFNYQLVSSIFRAIADCSKLIAAVCSTLADAVGEIFHYLMDVFAECGNVAHAFMRLGSKFLYLIYYIISLAICGVIYIGEGITAFIATCLRVVLLYLGRVGSNVASTWSQLKTAIADVAPEYMDSITLSVNKFTTLVNNLLQNGAKYMAATVGAILGAAYESMSITARDCLQFLTVWCNYVIEITVHSLATVVLHIKSGFEYVALAIHKHVNVDCYMFVFLATTVFICVKVLLDYMNKRDLTLPLPGFGRQTRIRLRNGRNNPAYVFDSSDEEIFGSDEYNEEVDDSEELSVTTSEGDEFDDSDSITHEEYEVGSEDSDDSLESEGGMSVQIQLPPPGGYNLRTRKKSPSPNPSHSAGASPETHIGDEEELNRKCVACQDQPKTVLVLPCKHMCLCVDCAHTIASQRSRVRRVCPLCRGRIQTVMNVYL